ncbi:sensor histidine kinase [Pseudomonas asuensis]|jgi:signal transduction histidine kinase|uniref:histidine kinase n=1 Tax=Pseudomonas asuensis TaxID=1825787 RepID=A0ABQ2GXV2_9PSED|nr:GAF domain-containing sensor histidine kinase [Pseudomonas asuensis]GGM17451.1 sensor histidine kinase [Pseudomonas asuensis]
MIRTLENDLSIIARISAVGVILKVISESTRLRFAAVARVTEDSWTTCAVHDLIGLGLNVGDELDVTTTLCREVHANQNPILIKHVSADSRYCKHPTPLRYGFESYISVPIFRRDGSFFGTLCAVDPEPADLDETKTLAMMESFTHLLALEIETQENLIETESKLLDEKLTAKSREHFLALVGHDLRNPLFSISAGAQRLLRKSHDEQERSLVELIHASAQRALRLVEDVLDFSRGQLGNGIPLAKEERRNLELHLKQVVDELQATYPERRIESAVNTLGTVYCDSDRLAQLLSNLTANAIQHGNPEHPILISAHVDKGLLTLSVHNDGEPLPEGILSGMFQPYWRASRTTLQTNLQQGLGIGLYIVNEIARSHGGQIQVTSNHDEGTVFTLTMPVNC